MRIARLEARAFGALDPAPLELPDGLVVLLGPNEAGKSTRMDLLRYVLFGQGALGEPKREPRGGGSRSGSVDLVAADGRRLRVARTQGRPLQVLDEAGEPVGEVRLDELLGDTRGEIFRTVQTFDSDSLASSRLLKNDDVRSNLLMSALLGSGEGATEAVRELAGRAEAIYLPGGTSEARPYTNRVRLLRSAREQRTETIRERVTFDQLRALEEEAEAALAAARVAERAAREQAAASERLLAVREAVELLAELQQAAPAAGPTVVPALVASAQALRARVEVARTALGRHQRAAEAVRTATEAEVAARGLLGLSAGTLDLGAEGRLTAAAGEVRTAMATEAAARQAVAEAEGGLDAAALLATPGEPGRLSLRTAVLICGGIASAGVLLAVAGVIVGVPLLGLVGVVVIALGLLVPRSVLSRAGASAVATSSFDAMLARRRAQLADAETARVAAEQGWSDTVAALGLTAGLAPAQLERIQSTLRELVTVVAALQRAREDAAEEERVVASFVAAGQQLIEALGSAVPTEPQALLAAVEQAIGELDQAVAAAAAHREAVAEHRAHLAGAQADVDRLTGHEPALVEQATAAEIDQLTAELALVQGELHEQAAQIEEAIERRTTARDARHAAQESADVAGAELAVQMATEDVRSAADRWLTLALASAVTTAARDRYVEARQPAVLQAAGARISQATDGKWVDIRIPDGDEEGSFPVAVAGDGERLSFAELSKGAAALVYLCLRIGLVGAFDERVSEPLPVLMDDVLTHLDDERMAGAAAAIGELAVGRQVLYFTCHGSHVTALQAAVPDLTVLRLDRL